MSVAEDVGRFLADRWDPDADLHTWRNVLAETGWGCPTWPVEWYGRGLGRADAEAVASTFDEVGAVGVAAGAGMALAAPTILEHGSSDVKARILRPTITGEATWCQLFSEPGSGSDLAGLTTSAVADGDEWIVNGQKVWTTNAHRARFGMLVARTDWDVPKHAGLTYFAIPMDQPGVDVRPLRQMNRYASFNEVFLTDARVPATNVVGEVGHGWAVALTTLAHERGLGALRFGRVPAGASGRCAESARAETAEYAKTYVWYPQRAGRPDLLTSATHATSTTRQAVAEVHARQSTMGWTAARAAAARAAGRPGAEGSILKVASSDVARHSARAHAAAIGAAGMLAADDPHADPTVSEILVSTPAQSIAGGTDEIQRNILGERVLGLPKEPQVDRAIPFREVRRN